VAYYLDYLMIQSKLASKYRMTGTQDSIFELLGLHAMSNAKYSRSRSPTQSTGLLDTEK
jgi:hypothetical protein